MDFLEVIILFLGAMLAGIVNTIAGGGTLLTVPLLVLVGLTPNVANATNRLAVLVQSLVASATFHKKKIPFIQQSVRWLPTGLLGAGLGTYLATVISNDAFRILFGILMVPIALVFVFYKTPTSPKKDAPPKQSGLEIAVAFFGFGFFAGFIQAGVGVMILSVLVLIGGFDIRKGNAVKVFTVAAFSALSLLIFALELEIDWVAGVVVAIGAGVGGYLGSLSVIRHGGKFVRPVMLLVCTGLAIRMITG